MASESEYIDFSIILNSSKKVITKITSFKYLEQTLFALVVGLAVFLRTRNLPLLQGKYLVGLDPYYYFRQAREIIQQGFISNPDMFRNPPFGVENIFDLFPYFMAYWSKLLGIFGVSQEMAHIIYPPVIMGLSLIPFYLFIKTVLNKRVALLSTLFLSIVPGYLFRTSAGFADHESIAMLFVFSALWMFSKSELEKSNKKYKYMILAGFFTLIMALLWMAYPFLLMAISMYFLFKMFFGEVDLKSVGIWFGIVSVGLIISGIFNLMNYGILFSVGVITILIAEKLIKKFKFNVPSQIGAVLFVGVGGFVFNLVFKIVDINLFLFRILNAGGSSKVSFTTSEIARSFVMSGNGYFSGFSYLIFIAIAGLFVICLKLFKNLNNRTKWLTSITIAGSVSLVLLGNWTRNLNIMKDSYIQFMAVVGILFLSYYLYLFYTSDQFSKISNIKHFELLLPLALFITSGLLARTAVRFVFLFAPAVAIFAGIFFDDLIEHAKRIKFGKIAIIGIILIFSFNLVQVTYAQNQNMGSGLPGQWESSMDWINNNTASDAIIAHWWDYGYWTQAVAERTSVQDGAKPGGGFMIYTLARYGMTHDNVQESLEYFKAHDTTHLLYSSEEIGKYGAFAYLGSDKNNDRASVIGTFGLTEINEVRSGNKLVYTGQWRTDDIIVEGKQVIPAGSGYISKIEIYLDEEGIYRPAVATLVASNYQTQYEIGCIYVENVKYTFENDELKSCIRIIPSISGQNKNDVGGLLYLSEKVKEGLFAKLYINSINIPEFVEIYNDGQPLAIYSGRLIGPIKIWKLAYPNNLNNVDRFLDVEKMPEFEENYVL